MKLHCHFRSAPLCRLVSHKGIFLTVTSEAWMEKKKRKKRSQRCHFFGVGGVVLDAVVSTSSWVMRPNQKQSTFSWEEYPLWHDWLHLPPRTLIRAACLSPSLTKLFFPSLTNFIRNFLSVVTSQRGSGARGGLEWEERHEADWIFSVEQGEGSIYRFGDVKHGHAQTCFISRGLMLGLMWGFFFSFDGCTILGTLLLYYSIL